MEQLVFEGTVTYLGNAQSVAASRHFLALAAEQCVSNLQRSFRGANRNERCWAPLQEASEGRRASPLLRLRIEQHRPHERYEGRSSRPGARHRRAAVVSPQSRRHGPIVGPRTAEQRTRSLRALAVALGADAPPPRRDQALTGGEVPEAYGG
jgi:hypothetical protein